MWYRFLNLIVQWIVFPGSSFFYKRKIEMMIMSDTGSQFTEALQGLKGALLFCISKDESLFSIGVNRGQTLFETALNVRMSIKSFKADARAQAKTGELYDE